MSNAIDVDCVLCACERACVHVSARARGTNIRWRRRDYFSGRIGKLWRDYLCQGQKRCLQ